MEVRKVGGVIGAEVRGVDLRTFAAATIEPIESALHEHGVLFFPDQHLTDPEQIELARAFGEPSIYPISKIHGATEPVCSVIEDGPDSPPSTDGWHTDVTWIETPPKIAILCGLEVPRYGGDTAWASAVDVYDSLSPAVRGILDGLDAEHTCWPGFCVTAEEKSGIEGLGRRIADAYPPVMHPLVRTHPVTGRRAIYDGSSTMRGVDGLTDSEWEPLRDLLRSMFDEPKRQVRWRWTEGDVAIWDERLVVHRGISDHFPQRRVVRRITVDGERPYFDGTVGAH
ncbi:MAG: TauD/TfdA family dioxygenase [Actinomycetota bacterium]